MGDLCCVMVPSRSMQISFFFSDNSRLCKMASALSIRVEQFAYCTEVTESVYGNSVILSQLIFAFLWQPLKPAITKAARSNMEAETNLLFSFIAISVWFLCFIGSETFHFVGESARHH